MLQFFKKSGRKDSARSTRRAPVTKNSGNRVNDASVVRSTETQSSALCSLEEEEKEGRSNDRSPEVSYSHSRLSKSLSEILADKGALGYFIQFMESRGCLSLIKFWMEVECICGPYAKEDDGNVNRQGAGPLGEAEDSCLDGHSYPGCAVNIKASRSRVNEPESDCPRNFSTGRQPVSTIKQDALRIYGKYIADGALPIDGISRRFTADIDVSLTCENFESVINCLSDIQRLVYTTLEDEYINDFLRSDLHCKHQIDVLTSGDVKLADILYNETAFFYFMEFMELENKRELLDFWMTAVNYKQNLLEKSGRLSSAEAQMDALIIYDKYFSLQATMPLGFTDKIRFQVEQNICQEGGDGPQPDCFDRPCHVVYNFLSKHYLPAFLSSQLYYKYLTELIGTIQSGACTAFQHHRVRRAGSDCSSEMSTLSIGTQDTSTSMSTITTMKGNNLSRLTDDNTRNNNGSMNIDTRQLYDPDSLWRRAKSSLSVGYVDDMGRFMTEIEPDPRRKYESRLSRAVKRFIHIDQDKAKEELAWKIAEMIVREITSLTLGTRDVST